MGTRPQSIVLPALILFNQASGISLLTGLPVTCESETMCLESTDVSGQLSCGSLFRPC